MRFIKPTDWAAFVRVTLLLGTVCFGGAWLVTAPLLLGPKSYFWKSPPAPFNGVASGLSNPRFQRNEWHLLVGFGFVAFESIIVNRPDNFDKPEADALSRELVFSCFGTSGQSIWYPVIMRGTPGPFICLPLWIPFILFGATTSRLYWLKYRASRIGCCQRCGYSLVGLLEPGHCPECGR